MRTRSAGFVSLATLLVIGGLAVIVVLTWLPYSRAASTAAIERTTLKQVRSLLRATLALPRCDLTDAGLATKVAERVARATGAEFTRLDLGPSSKGFAFWFRSEDYAFMACLANSKDLPAPVPVRLPLEVYAWPISRWSDGRSAFFWAEDLPLAHSRNLHAGYVGLEPAQRPVPGAGRPRDVAAAREEGDYRGHDDERWILARP